MHPGCGAATHRMKAWRCACNAATCLAWARMAAELRCHVLNRRLKRLARALDQHVCGTKKPAVGGAPTTKLRSDHVLCGSAFSKGL